MINSLIDALRPFKVVSFTFDLLLSIYHRYDMYITCEYCSANKLSTRSLQ